MVSLRIIFTKVFFLYIILQNEELKSSKKEKEEKRKKKKQGRIKKVKVNKEMKKIVRL